MPPDDMEERRPAANGAGAHNPKPRQGPPVDSDRSTPVRERLDEHAERLLELAGEWAKGVLADVTVLAEKAAARAREIPDQPQLAREVAALWVVVGELLCRVAVLELDLQERDAERRRQRDQGRTGAA